MHKHSTYSNLCALTSQFRSSKVVSMVQLSTEKDQRVLHSLKVLNLLVLAIFELVATISQKFFPGRRLHNMHHGRGCPKSDQGLLHRWRCSFLDSAKHPRCNVYVNFNLSRRMNDNHNIRNAPLSSSHHPFHIRGPFALEVFSVILSKV